MATVAALAAFRGSIMKSHFRKNERTGRNDQQSNEAHYSARELYARLNCPYPGTEAETCKDGGAGSPFTRQDLPEKNTELVSDGRGDPDSLIKDDDWDLSDIPIWEDKKIYRGERVRADRRGRPGGQA